MAPLLSADAERVEIVSHTAGGEVLQDLGFLEFEKSIMPLANITIWPRLGAHSAFCGEFAFQAKFAGKDRVHEATIDRCERLYMALQVAARDWIMCGTAKTALVYCPKGATPALQEQERACPTSRMAERVERCSSG